VVAYAGKDRTVAVVGASTSGLFAASLLAESGLRVTVFERADELDPAPRTLIVTGKMLQQLGSLGRRCVVNEINRFELFANGKAATVTLGEPDLIIERATLIRELAKEAEAAGVDFRFGSKVQSLESSTEALTLELEGPEGTEFFSANTVIGADGVSSSVARAAGWPKQPTLPLVQAIVALPADCPRDTTRVWFRPQDSRYFYWLLPDSDTHGALGLIGEPIGPARVVLDAFLREKGFEVLGYQAARIPCYAGWIDPRRRLQGGDVYLVGDAAGQVKVSTVGGIVTGLRGAKGAAESILHGGRTKELRSLRIELDLHLYIRRALHGFSTHDYSNLLDLMNAGVLDSLRSTNRDQTPSLFLRLARSQPRLALLLAKGVLNGKDFRQAIQAAA
jgi:flavin-dependent dehydrogenase